MFTVIVVCIVGLGTVRKTMSAVRPPTDRLKTPTGPSLPDIHESPLFMRYFMYVFHCSQHTAPVLAARLY